jgi:hypothetical protein
MKVRTSYKVLEQALDYVNSLFDNNIVMEVKDRGLYHLVRLKVKNSKGKGARKSPNNRRLPHACWHAYGYFISRIFELDPEAVVYTAGEIFRKHNWYWKDWNAGSLLNPVYISELCDCGKDLTDD